MGPRIVIVVAALAGCATAPGPAPVVARAVPNCDGLPGAADRRVAQLLPGVGASECVVLVEENVSAIRSQPGAWVRRDGTWSFRKLPDADGAAWQHAVVDGDAIVAVVDNVIESPGWELSTVASTDGGLTWQRRSQLRKPYYFAVARGLEMRADRGRLSVELDDDYGAGARPGRYDYVTRDGGRHWRLIEFNASSRRVSARR